MAISKRFQDRFEAFVRTEIAAERHHASDFGFRGAITVSREAGARSTPICEHLADYLAEEDESTEHGWSVHDKELVQRIIDDNHLPPSVDKYLQEDKIGFVDDYLAQVMKTHPSDWELFHHTVNTVRKLARLGGVVVIGRGGNFITSNLPNTLHIRLVGTERARIADVQRSRNLQTADAAKYVKDTDKARRDYVQTHFHKDIADPLAYHAVVRTDGVPDEVVARMVGDLYMDWAVAKAETAGKLVAMT